MGDEDFDEDDDGAEPQAQAKSKPPERVETHKDILDFVEGEEDCYWCGRVFKKSGMRKQREHNSIVYVCGDCSPR